MDVDEGMWWEEDHEEEDEINPLELLVGSFCCCVCMPRKSPSRRMLQHG
jgi:uncharacterized OsmC-like protein